MRHLVFQGSSGCELGRSITRLCTIERIEGNALISRSEFGDRIALVEVGFYSYVSISRLVKSEQQPSHGLSSLSSALSAVEFETLKNWAKLRRVADRAHKHTCGHPPYSDMSVVQYVDIICPIELRERRYRQM